MSVGREGLVLDLETICSANQENSIICQKRGIRQVERKGRKIMNAMTVQIVVMSLLFVGILAMFVKGGFVEDMKLWWDILRGKDVEH